MYIAIIWRRSGIAILIYVALSFWLTSYGFDKPHSLNNAAYSGWAFFYAGIAALLHALLLLLGRNSTPEESTAQPQDENALVPPPEPVQHDSIWHHSFFYIPVVIWPLIFGGLFAYFLTKGGPDKEEAANNVSPKEEIKKPVRTIHFFNLSTDTLKYTLLGAENWMEKKQVSPNRFNTTVVEEDSYFFGVRDNSNNILRTLPDSKFAEDTSKYISLRGETPSKNDYDDAWFIMDTAHGIALVEVTDICNAEVTRKAIEKKEWKKLLVETHNGRGLIEPLFKKDPGQGRFTVLHPGEKFPQQLSTGERVFALFAFPSDQELDDKYLVKKVLQKCPESVK